jgi:hypothetical protein
MICYDASTPHLPIKEVWSLHQNLYYGMGTTLEGPPLTLTVACCPPQLLLDPLPDKIACPLPPVVPPIENVAIWFSSLSLTVTEPLIDAPLTGLPSWVTLTLTEVAVYVQPILPVLVTEGVPTKVICWPPPEPVAPSAATTLLKTLPTTGPSCNKMAMTTIATRTRIRAYSTNPCPSSRVKDFSMMIPSLMNNRGNTICLYV